MNRVIILFLSGIFVITLTGGHANGQDTNKRNTSNSYIIACMVDAYMHDYFEYFKNTSKNNLTQEQKIALSREQLSFQKKFILGRSKGKLKKMRQFIQDSKWSNRSVLSIIDTLENHLNNSSVPASRKLSYHFSAIQNPDNWKQVRGKMMALMQQKAPASTPPTAEEQQRKTGPAVGSRPQTSGNSNNLATFLLILILLGLAAIIILFQKSNRKIREMDERLESVRDRYNQFNQARQTQKLEERLSEISRQMNDQIQQVINKMDQMEKENQKKPSQGQQTPPPSSEQPVNKEAPKKPVDKEAPQKPKKEKNKIAEKFFDAPHNNVFEYEEHKSERIYYRLRVNEKKGEGEFDFYPGDKSAKNVALEQLDDYIKPACEIENINMNHPQDIIPKSPGKVEKKDGQWEITQKAKVRFS